MTTTNPPLHPHPMTPIRNENEDFSILERNHPVNVKRKALNSTFSSKSLTTDNVTSFNLLVDQNKYFSNSLDSCLNMKNC